MSAGILATGFRALPSREPACRLTPVALVTVLCGMVTACAADGRGPVEPPPHQPIPTPPTILAYIGAETGLQDTEGYTVSIRSGGTSAYNPVGIVSSPGQLTVTRLAAGPYELRLEASSPLCGALAWPEQQIVVPDTGVVHVYWLTGCHLPDHTTWVTTQTDPRLDDTAPFVVLAVDTTGDTAQWLWAWNGGRPSGGVWCSDGSRSAMAFRGWLGMSYSWAIFVGGRSALVWLSTGPAWQSDVYYLWSIGDVRWAADCQSLDYTVAMYTVNPVPGMVTEAMRYDARTRQITSLDARFQCASSVAWSRDGSRLACVRPDTLLHLLDADGPGDLALGVGWDPDFSPDGRHLLFARPSATRWSATDVWIAGTDGSASRLLASIASCPRWSPDGSMIAFLRADTLVMADSEGTPIRSGPVSVSCGEWVTPHD